MNRIDLWNRYRRYLCVVDSVGLSLDISRMRFDDRYFERMAPAMERAYEAMERLEKGDIANPDENRMVGHYWLRQPDLAPTAEITNNIKSTVERIRSFAAEVHSGKLKPPAADRFTRVLSIGVGGSALGPMFVSDALGHRASDRMPVHFIDNTDPDGMERALSILEGRLAETLCVVISKSGETPETRNGMLYAAAAYKSAGLDFARHAVATTGVGSKLDQQAQTEGWITRFPMWEWVGGRTSELSAVGLLPAALQGLDIDALMAGAAACDEATRTRDTRKNPSALMALMWHHATGGRGAKHMVILPYKDRLVLLGRYLQQLIMESLGKRTDLAGNRVDQGITVYGNKGSTDQHAYVQQLRDGINNFFVTFIRVLESGRAGGAVERGVTSGDYLHGFLLGTREALHENDRESMTLTVRRVDARTIGVLIGLFERTVGLYAFLVGINAYDQPGVEAGKKAASAVLALQGEIARALSSEPQTAGRIAERIGSADSVETVYAVLEHLAANGKARIVEPGEPDTITFAASG